MRLTICLIASAAMVLPGFTGSALPVSAQDPSPVGALPGLDPSRSLGQLSLRLWTEREGLPQNFVTSLAQTPDGYLWAGSERGLVRFDGRRFTVYTPQNAPGLPMAWVTALLADPDGTLWIGTGGDGLVRLRSGEYSLVPGSAEAMDVPISTILRDGEGRLWVGTEGRGVFRVEEGPGEIERVGREQGLSTEQVSDLALGSDGTLWVASPAGIDRIDPSSGEVLPLGFESPSVGVQALSVDPDGTLWIGTWGRGLLRVPEGGSVAEPEAPELAGAFISVLERDREGSLWIGTNGGGLYRKWNGEVERLPDRTDVPTHLVRALLEDREGNLWIGLIAAGLARLQDGMFDHVGSAEGLSMNVALAVRQTGDGAIWTGTPGAGVNRIEADSVTSWGTAEGLGSDFVVSVDEAPDGAVWVGTSRGGASRIENGLVETFGLQNGLPSAHVSVVHHDQAGRLWLGFGGAGLLRWRPGPPLAIGVAGGLPNGFVTTILEDGADGRWVGTRNGLARVEGEAVVDVLEVSDGLPHGFVTGMYRDGSGSLWVATMGGLARVRGGEVRALGEGEGLPPMEPMGVLEDGQGNLWISTSQGIIRAVRSELDAVADGELDAIEDVRMYDRADGLRSAEANGAIHPSGWRADDGSLWFPTMAGLLRIDPARSERPVIPVAPRIESLLAEGRRVPVEAPVRLDPSERTLEFRFSAPTFVAPERVELRYRLEGFDQGWLVATEPPVARYTSLPPGEYRFRVEASDRQGRWTGQEAVLEVTAPPLFLERWDVRAAAVIAVLLLTGLTYRSQIRGLKRRERVLVEAIEERERATAALREREEELRQAHKMEAVGQLAGGVAHDLNNLLTVISMSAHLAAEARSEEDPSREDLEAAIQATDRATQLIGQLLAFSRRQVLQPRDLDLNECVRGVEGMLRRLIRADVILELELGAKVDQIRADRNGVEQILVNLAVNAQDAMPGGGAVTIATRNEPGWPDHADPVLRRPHVVLSVSDTGRGIDPDTLNRVFEPFFTTKGVGEGTGMGLASVYGIVRQSGGRAEVSSRLGEGTIFTIRFPRAGDPPLVESETEGADVPEGGGRTHLVG